MFCHAQFVINVITSEGNGVNTDTSAVKKCNEFADRMVKALENYNHHLLTKHRPEYKLVYHGCKDECKITMPVHDDEGVYCAKCGNDITEEMEKQKIRGRDF